MVLSRLPSGERGRKWIREFRKEDREWVYCVKSEGGSVPMMVGVGGDDHGDDGVGVGRAVTRVYMLDAAETSYSSPGGKISNVRGRIGYTRRAIVPSWNP